MDITSKQINGLPGFRVEWISKDFNKPGDDFDPDNVEYSNLVFSDLKEAKQEIEKRVKVSPIEWGSIHNVEFEYIEGIPHGWTETDDYPIESY